MLSDHAVSFFGYTFSSLQLLLGGALLLLAAVILFMLRSGKRVSVQRSMITDELMIHLERIGDSLERLNNEVRGVAAYLRETRSRETLPPLQTGDQPHPISYSMFGR
jgi:hypothetical protein